MIKSFKHKGLAELFEQGRTRRIQQSLQSRCLRRLDALDQTESLKDLNVPGFNFHGLQGTHLNVTLFTLTDHGVSPFSGRKVKR